MAILQKEHAVLREKARDVPLSDIGSKKIKAIINRMKEALDGEKDGVAIAAPQIGESVRIFIVSPIAFAECKDAKPEDIPNETLVFINPEIIKKSRKTEFMDEGCLSVRPLYGDVRRASKATVRAYDRQGKSFERGGSGLLAQIFQHEIDHLDGILFIDKAKNIREMHPEETKEPEI
ncbi:MAG: peptide deformylase [Candidatus Paceibacterota bacterium]